MKRLLPVPLSVPDESTEEEEIALMKATRGTVQEEEPVALAQAESVPATESPESAPAPADTGMGEDVEQWRSLVTVDFGADLADTALCLMQHESGGNPNAQNSSSGASGLDASLPIVGPGSSDIQNPIFSSPMSTFPSAGALR